MDPHPALLLYGICLLPRLALLLATGFRAGEGPLFLYASREIPFWDPFPVHFYRVTHTLCGGNGLLQAGLYAVLAAAVAPAVWRLALALGLSRRTALWAGGGVALYPYYVSTAWFQPEVGVGIAIASVFVMAIARLAEGPTWGRALAAAAAALVFLLERGESLLLVVFLGVVAWLSPAARGRRGPVLAFGGWVAAGLLLVSLGNALTQGYFSPLPRKSGYNLLLGHNDAIGGYLRDSRRITNPEYTVRNDVFSAYPSDVDSAATDARYSDLFTHDALSYARSHPGVTLRNAGYKFLRYWDWRLEDADRQGRWKNAAYTVPYLVVGILAAVGVGVLALRRRWYPLLFLTGTLLVASLPAMISIPIIRVRMYTEFLLILLAAVGITRNGGDARGPAAEAAGPVEPMN